MLHFHSESTNSMFNLSSRIWFDCLSIDLTGVNKKKMNSYNLTINNKIIGGGGSGDVKQSNKYL